MNKALSAADCLHRLWYYYALVGNYQCVSCGLIESYARHERRLADCLHRLWYYYALVGNYQCVSCGLIESHARHERRLLKKPEPVVERKEDGLPLRRYQKE